MSKIKSSNSSSPNRRAVGTWLLAAPAAGSLAACETMDLGTLGSVLGGPLSQSEAGQGIKAALANGVLSALGIVGQDGGFLNNNLIRIPLPGFLGDAQSVLRQVGAAGLLDNLEVALNRGAEIAAPVGKQIFMDAVTGLSFQDAINIVRGADDAATQYLKASTTDSLTTLFSPIMENALGNTGALRLFDQVASQVNSIPFTQNLGASAKTDLIRYGVGKGLDGVFTYVAKEEKAIRDNPAARTSEILRRVFGGYV